MTFLTMPEKLTLVVFTGLPASGKSTFYVEAMSANFGLVSKDLMAKKAGKQGRMMKIVRAYLEQGKSLAVDNTNPRVEDRAPLIQIAREFQAKVVCLHFTGSEDDCRRRNAGREGKAYVPPSGFHTIAMRFVAPTWAEGFDEIHQVRLVEGAGFVIRPLRLN